MELSMSKWMMTKLASLSLAVILILTLSLSFNSDTQSNACVVVESNLPSNHSLHPCNAVYKQNNSWLSWVSNDKKSIHLHFLDLVELLHYSFR